MGRWVWADAKASAFARPSAAAKPRATEYPELNAVRGFVLAQRTGFHFSNRLCRYLLDLSYTKRRMQFDDVQLQHYKRILLPQTLLSHFMDQMRIVLNKNPDSTYLPSFPRSTQREFSFDHGSPYFEFASNEADHFMGIW